ncbi:MAG: histidinol-phosphatase [Bacteroidales bacterium]|nr:histidinol-phosphatase [Bacteroidales bacterium]
MIDFKTITKNSKLYNFHSHSPYCDGHAPIEEFIKEAIKAGFTHYGVSPHSPIPFYSPCNMAAEKVGEYLAEMDRLKALYGDQINIYTSMEIDYLDGWGASHPFFQEMPLDYRIGSVHFIKSMVSDEYVDIDGNFENFKQKMARYFNNDIRYVVKEFFFQSVMMVAKGGFDIIGHCDKIGHNASAFQPGIDCEPWYEALVETLIDAIMDKGILVEINTKKWETDQRFFPHARFFELLKKYNAPLIVNSDAHHPHLINSGRMEALRMLEEI